MKSCCTIRMLSVGSAFVDEPPREGRACQVLLAKRHIISPGLRGEAGWCMLTILQRGEIVQRLRRRDEHVRLL